MAGRSYLCIVLGALASVIAGFVLALPALRVRGPYFGLTTLVAVLMLQNFIVVFADLTGGEIGLTIPDVISIDAGVNYWIALGFMTISAIILYGLSQSPIGLVLQASGQDPVQAGALGFNIVKAQARRLHRQRLLLGTLGARSWCFTSAQPQWVRLSTSRSGSTSSLPRCWVAAARCWAQHSARSS